VLRLLRTLLPGRPAPPAGDDSARAVPVAADPFEAGTFPFCPATHDTGLGRLFDLATLLLLLDCRPGDRVLDLGAGCGFSSEMLARFGYRVVAADPDHRALRQNRRRSSLDRARLDGDVRVACAVAERLPFADASFDGILGLNVMHHVDDLPRAIDEIARVLGPGARAVFCEPGLDHLAASETQRARREHGEDDKAFDVIAFLREARGRGFAEAMLPATLQSPLSLLPVEEVDLYASGTHPRAHLRPSGVLDELHRRHAYAMLVRAGSKPRTSRHPGRLARTLRVEGLPARATAGQTLRVHVEAVNTGDTTWIAEPSTRGGFVTVGLKLLAADGQLLDDTLGRTLLPVDVPAGARATVTVHCTLPVHRGDLQLEVDLVDELICWFADLDRATAVVYPLRVE
jgi:SAM-dependent methyltransferase